MGGGGTHFELIEKSNNLKLKIQNRSKLDQNGPKGVQVKIIGAGVWGMGAQCGPT